MDDLDRILASEDPLVPSRGFTARVMEAVDAAATEPPPLPFPWARFAIGRRCLPGLRGIVGVGARQRRGGRTVLDGLDMLPGLGEALVAAVVSVSVAQVFRHRARAGF